MVLRTRAVAGLERQLQNCSLANSQVMQTNGFLFRIASVALLPHLTQHLLEEILVRASVAAVVSVPELVHQAAHLEPVEILQQRKRPLLDGSTPRTERSWRS